MNKVLLRRLRISMTLWLVNYQWLKALKNWLDQHIEWIVSCNTPHLLKKQIEAIVHLAAEENIIDTETFENKC